MKKGRKTERKEEGDKPCERHKAVNWVEEHLLKRSHHAIFAGAGIKSRASRSSQQSASKAGEVEGEPCEHHKAVGRDRVRKQDEVGVRVGSKTAVLEPPTF